MAHSQSQAMDRFGLLIGDVGRLWRQRLDQRLKPLGLSQAKWRTLLRLSLGDGISQRELSQRLDIEGPTLVGLLDRLSRDGYIERRESTRDRRSKTVHLTPKARKALVEINRVAVQLRDELLGDMPASQLRGGIESLQRIRDKLCQRR